MKFTKMHGAGNDFIIINNMVENIEQEKLPGLAKKLCAQHTGVGADGMMVVTAPKSGGDFAMLFYNADGSLGEMCGNGARCICRYGYEKGLAPSTQRVETTAGLVSGERIDRSRYRIRLTDATVFRPHCRVLAQGRDYDCAYIELGRPGLPHAIVQLKGFAAMEQNELRELGRALRHAPEFPRGANVSFVDVRSRGLVDIITFERGVEDFTLACGTGCGSAALALNAWGLTESSVKLHAPGGELLVDIIFECDTAKDIFLSGPACLVFEAELGEDVLAEI